MAIARNWLQTLWRTSYKGAAFWVETETEGGARRIVIHEFPMRDTPYLEDLGERYREFTVTAYVASDRADSEAAALMATCAQRGAGILVLPTQGPVTVRCLEFGRKHEKDKLGYQAHELRFVREGASGALATVASLLNMVFVQAENAANAIADAFAVATTILAVPDYVRDVLQNGTETALATFEVMRGNVVLPDEVSADQRDALQSAYSSLPLALTDGDTTALQTVAKTTVEAAMAIAENAEPTIALSAMAEILDQTPVTVVYSPPLMSVWHGAEESNAQAANALLRLAAIVGYCEAVVKVKLKDRPSAITLRANVSRYIDAQMEALPSYDNGMYPALLSLRDATIDYLSRSILDLAPVVQVSASLGMPSLYWSWRIYGTADRAEELADRNRVPHPSFMPNTFEALSK